SARVPTMRWCGADDSSLGAPFFVMGKVDGRAPTDTPPYTVGGWLLEESSPEPRRTLGEGGIDAVAGATAAAARGRKRGPGGSPRRHLARPGARVPRQAAVRPAGLRAAAAVL